MDDKQSGNDGYGESARYAGFWKRFAAFVIDIFVLSVGDFFIGIIFGIPYDVLTGRAEVLTFAGDYTLSFILSVFIAWIYGAVMESSKKQASLGKMALGILVTDLSGGRISFAKASGRYFGKIVSSITLGIGFIMIAFTRKKQGLHDIMAKCLVINK